MKRSPKNVPLFKCGVGLSQAAITPQGEIKPCLMIEKPKYNILRLGLPEAWRRLKKRLPKEVAAENFPCSKCKLETYCKWCPGQSWLYNRTYTSCVPELRKKAEDNKKLEKGTHNE